VIRVEIDSSLADYYPEIDAVSLTGTTHFHPQKTAEEGSLLKLSISGLSQKIIALGLHSTFAYE